MFNWFFRWLRGPEQVISDLATAQAAAIHNIVLEIARRRAPQIEAWMKSNRVWTDRTTNARTTLYTDVIDITNSAVIVVLGHGVDYGVFLELSNGGTYAIIGPALDRFAPIIWRDVQAALRV